MINKVILVGKVSKEPERRKTNNGKDVLTFSLETWSVWGGKTIQEWHRIVAFGKTSEATVSIGQMLGIAGKLQTRSWEDNGTKKYATEIVAHEITPVEVAATAPQRPATEVMDDVPF